MNKAKNMPWHVLFHFILCFTTFTLYLRNITKLLLWRCGLCAKQSIVLGSWNCRGSPILAMTLMFSTIYVWCETKINLKYCKVSFNPIQIARNLPPNPIALVNWYKKKLNDIDVDVEWCRSSTIEKCSRPSHVTLLGHSCWESLKKHCHLWKITKETFSQWFIRLRAQEIDG